MLSNINMQCFIHNEDDQSIISLTLSPETLIDTLKDLIQVEKDLSRNEQELFWNGRKLEDHQSLRSIGMKDQEMITLKRVKNLPLGTPLQKTDSLEKQHQIEEHIRHQNIQENFENALEFTPEAFDRVVMLYVRCKINGVYVNAFVDTGAQTTIMVRECAQRCNLMRLVDQRFQGVAVGVGSTAILGRVHLAQMQIGNTFFPLSLCLIESGRLGGPDLILGLDQLRKHRAHIDLDSNSLLIGGEIVPFLSEKELSEPYFSEEPKPRKTAAGNPVSVLLQMGFNYDRALWALKETGGDVEMAANLLFGGKM